MFSKLLGVLSKNLYVRKVG